MATCTGIAKTTTIVAADTEPRRRERPIRAAAWDRAIGFRVHRYGPTVTRAVGGIEGFGVPRPTRTKRAKHHARPANPTTSRISPIQRTGEGHGRIFSKPSIIRPAQGIPM